MSAGPEPTIVLFEYDPTRAGDVPKRLLAGFTGALHTDGYSGYAPVVREQGLVHLACRVGEVVADLAPHRPERAVFPHSVPHMAASLKRIAMDA